MEVVQLYDHYAERLQLRADFLYGETYVDEEPMAKRAKKEPGPSIATPYEFARKEASAKKSSAKKSAAERISQPASGSSSSRTPAPDSATNTAPQEMVEFCAMVGCYNTATMVCASCNRFFCENGACIEGLASTCLDCFSAKRRSSGSSVGARSRERAAKIEIKEEIDTDDDAPVTSDPYIDEAAQMTQLEMEYEAYLQGRRQRAPSVTKVRAIGAKIGKFAKSAAKR